MPLFSNIGGMTNRLKRWQHKISCLELVIKGKRLYIVRNRTRRKCSLETEVDELISADDGAKSKRSSILEWFDNTNIISEKGTAVFFFKMATEKREMHCIAWWLTTKEKDAITMKVYLWQNSIHRNGNTISRIRHSTSQIWQEESY